MRTWVKQIPHAPRQRPPLAAIAMMIEEECRRLVNDETYDEKGMDLDVLEVCQRITGKWIGSGQRWDEPMVDAFYGAKSDEMYAFLVAGDDCELGRFIRERAIKAFANDVFNAAEDEVLKL